MPTAIEIHNVEKRYEIGAAGASYLTAREALAALPRNLLRRRQPRRVHEALRGISIDVDEGEVLGVIGANGAGKSTLLKLLARITRPSSGYVRTRGRVGALLEVGTGFHPELTGRENVFLAASVLGMSRRRVTQLFDQIVEFAEVSDFIDTPVKRYSSGMYLRLAFSVAAHVDPEVLVVDEVLAVGDAAFQERCLGKMAELNSAGKTVVLVSHDLGAVSKLCTRAIWLDTGEVRGDGDPRAVAQGYLEHSLPNATRATPEVAGGPVTLREVALVGQDRTPTDRVTRGDDLSVSLRLVLARAISSFDMSIYLTTRDGTRVVDEALSDSSAAREVGAAGEYLITARLPGALAVGAYVLSVWIGTAHEVFLDQPVLDVRVQPGPDDSGEAIERRRLVVLDGEWRVNRDAAS